MADPEDREDFKIFPKTGRVTVEPMLLVNVIGMGAMFVTYQSFIIHTICMSRNERLNVTVVDCKNLQLFKEEEAEVEREAVEYLTYRKMLETSILVFYSLFVGDWVKKNGSKSMMVLPIVGFMLSALCLYFLALCPGIHPGYILLASLPVGLGGANFALFLSANNYVTRISTTENRSFRLAMAEGSAILGFPIGLWAGVQMGKMTEFTGVFLLCSCLQCIALMYTMFTVKNDGPTTYLSVSMFQGVCNTNSFRETARLWTRPRDDSEKLWMFLIFLIWSIRVLTFTGMENVLFLYTRLKFEWSSTEFTQFAVAETLLTVVGITIVTFAGIQFLRMRDTTLGVMGTFCTFCAALVFSFASEGWMAYLALGFQMFGGMISIIVRSLISKLVSTEEVAIAFVWIGVLEAVVPIVSAPLYGFIYSYTLTTLSNTVFLLTAAGSGISCAAFLYLARMVPVRKDGAHRQTDSSISLDAIHLE